jgi:hypothetical protein
MEVSAVLVATDGWRSRFPGAVVGALVMRGVHNPEHNVALEAANDGSSRTYGLAPTGRTPIVSCAPTATTTVPAAAPTT